MVNFAELFEGMGFDEMKDALKAINAEGRAYIKEFGAEVKAREIEAAKARLEEGMTVRVKYKDDVIEGEVVALRDKTFSLMTEDILNAKGEASRVSRNYNLVVWDEDAEDADEEVVEDDLDVAI